MDSAIHRWCVSSLLELNSFSFFGCVRDRIDSVRSERSHEGTEGVVSIREILLD
jgi:hypothetical protein